MLLGLDILTSDLTQCSFSHITRAPNFFKLIMTLIRQSYDIMAKIKTVVLLYGIVNLNRSEVYFYAYFTSLFCALKLRHFKHKLKFQNLNLNYSYLCIILGLLKKSAPSRIVFTSSISIFFYKLQLEDLRTSKRSHSINSAGGLYAKSKLAMLIASDIFNEKLKEKGVTSNAIHPGCISTTILTKMGLVNGRFFYKFLSFYLKIFGKTPWEGSQNIIHVAVSKKLQNVGGKFFIDCRPFFKPFQAGNKTFCQNIWLESEKCVGLRPNELL